MTFRLQGQSIKELIFLSHFTFLFIIIQSQSTNKHNKKMNIYTSQNQSSSQSMNIGQEPDLLSFANLSSRQLSPQQASSVASRLCNLIKVSNNIQFESCLNVVISLIEKGYTKQISKFSVILQYFMDQFSASTNSLQNSPHSEMKVIRLLSVVAELIKQAPQFQISLKKKFIKNLMYIDSEIIECSSIKKKILNVLGVIYQCISKQGKILKKFQLLRAFKKSILQNYRLIEQKFSLLLFNKAIYNLAIQGQSLTEAELAKYGVFEVLRKVIGSQYASLVIMKIKSAISGKTQKFIVNNCEMRAQN